MTTHTGRATRAHDGFTLFEVAISAGLVASCLVGVLLVFPIGLRAQQQARFQVYAGVKVLEMVDTFANHDHAFPSHQIEADQLGQAMTPHQWPVDLDRMMQTPALGLLPLPDTIARRLDSDGDEIAKVLDAGGRLYYASPAAYDVGYHAHSNGHNVNALAKERALPSEAQSILFAVVGDAQENALPGHPCLCWPYFSYYPSMPTNSDAGHSPWTESNWEYLQWVRDASTWGVPAAASAAFKDLADQAVSWNYSFYGQRDQVSDLPRLQKYIKDCQDILRNVPGVTLRGADPYLLVDPPTDIANSKPWSRNDPNVYPSPIFVGALRFLAAGALMRTGYRMVNGDGAVGNPAHPLTPQDIDYARQTQELSMLWVRRYAATNPYDWGAPRPLNRPSCFDFPLVQYDLFRQYTCTGSVAGDVSWLVTAPRMPENFSSAYSNYGMWAYNGGNSNVNAWPPGGNHSQIDASFTKLPGGAIDTSHFNLTAPFAAAERCRDIVCWAVDWKAYEDYESAPSSPWDSSICYIDSAGTLVDSEYTQYPPDLSLSWTDANRTAVVPAYTDSTDDLYNANTPRRTSVAYRQAFFGLWGVDRNGNGTFDRGPLPLAARLRAVSIGRWHYYDRRLTSALRN